MYILCATACKCLMLGRIELMSNKEIELKPVKGECSSVEGGKFLNQILWNWEHQIRMSDTESGGDTGSYEYYQSIDDIL